MHHRRLRRACRLEAGWENSASFRTSWVRVVLLTRARTHLSVTDHERRVGPTPNTVRVVKALNGLGSRAGRCPKCGGAVRRVPVSVVDDEGRGVHFKADRCTACNRWYGLHREPGTSSTGTPGGLGDDFRQRIAAILDAWERGDIGPWEVVEAADVIEQSLPEGRWEEDSFAVGAELISTLSAVPAGGILVDDIPAMRQLLLSRGAPEDWAEYQTYWHVNDLQSRRLRLENDPIYSPFLNANGPE